MSRRIYALILLLVLLIPILAACGQTDQPGGTGAEATQPAGAETPAAAAATPTALSEQGETPPPGGGASPFGDLATAGSTGDVTKIQVEDGAELRVATWGDPSEQEVNQAAFDRFKQLFPNVNIVYQPVPTEFQTTMKADMAGNTEPDVFYLDTSLMNAFAPNGLLLQLDDYMQQAGVSVDGYIGELAQIFQLDGKTYGLPKDFGALALFVNTDMAQQAGIDPQNIKTWDDWNNAAQQMTQGEGNEKVFGQCTSHDIQRVAALWFARGAEIAENNQAAFNTEDVVQATQFWYDMYRNGYAALPNEVGADWCGQAFGEGKVAMALEGGWMIPFLRREAPDVNYVAIPIPQPEGGQQASLVFTNAWAASARTQYPNAAAALVLFLTSAANQKPIMETGFALPTVTALLDDPYFEQHPNERVIAEAGEYGRVADLVFTREHKDDVIKSLNTAMESIWLGQQDIQPALDQAAQEVTQIVSQ
ncbi:MAG: ABC transporter substrate-binding protein [Herpetosiphonaceae bacterium]|nr:MAG: ABC transporter substrate-binding protein [Herpetosiphonaceae bacterium]